MNVRGLKVHRKLSWLLSFFSLGVLIIVSLRQFLETYSFYLILHQGAEWILLGILIFHCILSQKYLKLWWTRIYKGLKSKRSRPIYILRLIQLITNRAIIIFAALVVLSGFAYYIKSIGLVIPFELHMYYDFVLLILIIIHVAVGFKFMFMRRQIRHWSSNLFIILLSTLLIITITFTNFTI
ncbi:MAG: hypothetical protein ACFFAF_17170 [Candidatus Hermodarchaeota archaeon]